MGGTGRHWEDWEALGGLGDTGRHWDALGVTGRYWEELEGHWRVLEGTGEH